MKARTIFLAFFLTLSAVLLAQSGQFEVSKATITRYLESDHADLSMMADDVVFTNMATGETHTGPDEIAAMLHFVYHVAFDASAEIRNLIVDDNRAVLEAEIVGTHIGEFAGVPATNKPVRIPLCVVYDLDNGMITHGRIYFEVPAFMAQIQ